MVASRTHPHVTLETDEDVEPPTGIFVEDVEYGYDFANEIRNSSNSARHLYFLNCCCDFRKAVIMLNVLTIVMRILFIIIFFALANYATNNLYEVEAAIDDDALRGTVETVVESGMMPIVEAIVGVLGSIGIAFGGVAVYGAVWFRRRAIVVALWWYVFCLVMVCVALDILDAIFYALLVYAHWNMAKLMRDGVMTAANYSTIAACCGKK